MQVDTPVNEKKHRKKRSKTAKQYSSLKGKKGPKWKRELEKILIHFKVQAVEYISNVKKNQGMQRQLAIYILIATIVLFFIVVMLKGNIEHTTETLNVHSVVRTNTRAKPEPQQPLVLTLTKREREQRESGFDVSGNDLTSVRRRFGTRQEYESAMRTQPKLSSKIAQCYKSMPVTVTRDSPKFGVYVPKSKVFDLAVLQKAQRGLGMLNESDLKRASLVLKGIPHVPFRHVKEGKQYYDMIGNMGRIGAKKKTQLSSLRSHVRKFKCSFESLHIQPRSYDMNRPTDCKKFFSHPDKGQMWVLKSCKSGEGSKGAGISVIDDLGPTRREWSECNENAFNYVAQAYIEQPLLLKNRKFDMRVYLFVAATKPSYIVYFNPGYIRRSLAEYKPTSTQTNDVLTNYHIQVKRKDFSPGDAMWNFPQFIQYLRDEGKCEACGDIEVQLAKISKLVFDSGRNYYKRFVGSFQLVGLDFMMDANLNVQFIEGNVSPGIGSHNLKWKRELMEDLVTMMYEQVMLIHERPQEYDLRIGDRVYGKNNNYWELLVNEHYEKCNKQIKFDPCKELRLEGAEDDADDLKVAEEMATPEEGGDDDEES
mmetsp:Transcript_42341/g.67884  ORF Transcript_42341/g.67884 Transcript_42341/m.67884 type:complete len:594 (+) Transcript_42341:2182-3963(+)|eukprot:CAMPEP_0203759466 /NCGR_PEP_ID=MMETSP0098-20131031/12509_1 /ASSEMBLY_ACC=CAM_ASM_000208 /TAXON_ID=96639 /ORGANISM=" , Strain NY0313808BC1" /LENGTH=593 /DNA_ID=CAMNT_0050652451 /DNA_START=2107 /DNA_END=3888 /DNA_ORIENTATION=+